MSKEELKCPECGWTDWFLVAIPEYVYYEWEDNKWEDAEAWESSPTGAPYVVTCSQCDHSWEEEPWD